MATAARSPSGTFSSEHDDLGLYTLVRVVASFVSPDRPTLVTEAAWDAAREPSGHSNGPSARAICARLADRRGRPFAWKPLLKLVFDPSRDIKQTHAKRRGETDGDHLTEDHVFYALRRVANERKAKTLAPDAYARIRQQLIARDRRRGVTLLDDLLPTVGQVERIVGSWEGALAFAGLEPRNGDSWKGPKGMPIVEALDLHAESTGGWLCSHEALDAFCGNHDISLTRREKGKPWSAYVAEATELRATRDAETKGIAAADAGLNCKLPDGTRKKTTPRRHGPGYWTLELCVEAAQRYLKGLPVREPARKKVHLAWSGENDAPAPSAFDRHGGYQRIIKLARDTTPLPQLPTREEQIETAVLAHIAVHGKIKSADVQRLFGISGDAARRTLRRLRNRLLHA